VAFTLRICFRRLGLAVKTRDTLRAVHPRPSPGVVSPLALRALAIIARAFNPRRISLWAAATMTAGHRNMAVAERICHHEAELELCVGHGRALTAPMDHAGDGSSG